MITAMARSTGRGPTRAELLTFQGRTLDDVIGPGLRVRAVSPEPTAAQEPLAEGIHGCPTIVVASPDAPGLATG